MNPSNKALLAICLVRNSICSTNLAKKSCHNFWVGQLHFGVRCLEHTRLISNCFSEADYSISLFVAVSGKMIQGLNSLASSKSIKA